MDIIGIYLLDQNMGMAFVKVQMYTYTIRIGKVAICFKPFGFLLLSQQARRNSILCGSSRSME